MLVEVFLNKIGALTWEWRYWNSNFLPLIFLIGYFIFFVVGYRVHDMASTRSKVLAVSFLATVVVVSLTVFGGILGWI